MCCFSYLMRKTEAWKDVQIQRDCYMRYLNILLFFKIFQLYSENFYSKDLNLIQVETFASKVSNIYIGIVYCVNL